MLFVCQETLMIQLTSYEKVLYSTWPPFKIMWKLNWIIQADLYGPVIRMIFLHRVHLKLNVHSFLFLSSSNMHFHHFTDSYIEISRFYQGYIDNEINLNRDGSCQQTCEEYTETRHYHCADGSFCEYLTEPQKSNLICNGTVFNCQYFDGSFNICPAVFVFHITSMVWNQLRLTFKTWFFSVTIEIQAKSSSQRYKFIEYDDGRTIGGESDCNNWHTVRMESWWNWFVHCSNCFCYCEEPGEKDSDRFFSLRSAISNTKENKYLPMITIAFK